MVIVALRLECRLVQWTGMSVVYFRDFSCFRWILPRRKGNNLSGNSLSALQEID